MNTSYVEAVKKGGDNWVCYLERTRAMCSMSESVTHDHRDLWNMAAKMKGLSSAFVGKYTTRFLQQSIKPVAANVCGCDCRLLNRQV